MTTPSISREATDPGGTTTFPDPRHYGTNLAKPQPDPDDVTKVAFHDHHGAEGHPAVDHGHHLPELELSVLGDVEYVPASVPDQKMARSRVNLTAANAPLIYGQGMTWNSRTLPKLRLYFKDAPPAIASQDLPTIVGYTVELPIVIEECYAFLATDGGRNMPGLIGPMLKLPLPAAAPESSDGC